MRNTHTLLGAVIHVQPVVVQYSDIAPYIWLMWSKNFIAASTTETDYQSKSTNTNKIASLGRQEPQPGGTAKWPTTLRFGKILGTTSVVRSIENQPTRYSTKDSQAMISYK